MPVLFFVEDSALLVACVPESCSPTGKGGASSLPASLPRPMNQDEANALQRLWTFFGIKGV